MASISSRVVVRPRLKRIAPIPICGGIFIAFNTGDNSSEPEWQAEPVDAATFSIRPRISCALVARFVYNVPIPVERVIIFPMAIIPNLFGVWNMLYLASRSRTHLPLGIHGAILPFILAPAGFLLGLE